MASYNYVTVSGTFPTLTGTVTFTPPPQVTDVTGAMHILGPGTFTCTVSGGSFTSPPLLATDNVGLLPPSWAWNVTVALTGSRAYTYPVLVPYAAGSTATLSALPVSAAGGGGSFGDVTSVSAGDASIAVSGTSAVTVKTGTLDKIATIHPAAANWGNNGYQIKNLAGGTASTDAVILSQLQMIAAASAQSGGLISAGYAGAMSSLISGNTPAVSATKWTSGYLYGQWLFVVPSSTVNGYVSIAPWGGGALGATYVGLFNSTGTQLGVTSDLSSQSTAAAGIRVAASGFTATPSNGLIFMVYTNGTSATNAGPYLIQGQTYSYGYPTGTIPPGGMVLASKYSTASTMPTTITFGSNGVPSGWSDASPNFYQAFLD